ncbi:hypothetical protein [Nocardia xishanensis]
MYASPSLPPQGAHLADLAEADKTRSAQPRGCTGRRSSRRRRSRSPRPRRAVVQRLIDAVARHIREEQARGLTPAALDAKETARALASMDERYLLEALGREPRNCRGRSVQHLDVRALRRRLERLIRSRDRGRTGRRHRHRPARRQYLPEVDANPRSPANSRQPGGQ